MNVRAKFVVRSVKKQPHLGDDGFIEVEMDAATQGEENKAWSKWTPSGQLKMTITNPNVFDAFEEGKSVYLTFEPAP